MKQEVPSFYIIFTQLTKRVLLFRFLAGFAMSTVILFVPVFLVFMFRCCWPFLGSCKQKDRKCKPHTCQTEPAAPDHHT